MTIGDRTIGTCSVCGGAVTVPGIWGAIIPPVPTCSACGATKRESHGPVIDMEPGRSRLPTRGTGAIKMMSTVLEAQRSNGWPRPGRFTHDDAIGPDCFGGSDFDMEPSHKVRITTGLHATRVSSD